MISLALSFAKPRSSSEIGEAAAPAVDGKGAKGAFSAVLASLGQQKTADREELTTTPDNVADTAATGIVLPAPVETGKILPDITGAAAGSGSATVSEGADGGSGVETDGATSEAAAIAASLVQLPAAPAVAETSAPAEAKSARAFTGPSPQDAADGPPLSPIPQSAQASRTGSEPTDASSVALHVSPEPGSGRSGGRADGKATLGLADPSSAATAEEPSLPSDALASEPKHERGETSAAAEAATRRIGRRNAAATANAEIQPVKGREVSAEGMSIPRAVSADPAPQAPSVTFAQGLQAERTHAGNALDSARPTLQSEALQDLTRVVDRLAAAREAFAPAAAALAVKHADFGDLSLRFEQQRDGQLAVQLSASDPDAHRAIAAAVSERSNAATTDSHSGAGQSQAQARGAATERDGNGSNTAGNAERRDQSQQRRANAQDAQHGNGTRRNGVFA